MSVTPSSDLEPIERREVLDLLSSLVQKSMVHYEEDERGGGRYRLLETVRQYAQDRLRDGSGEPDLLGRQHAHFFLSFAEGGRDRPERLEAERDNFRTALEWLLEAGEADQACRFAEALIRFWSHHAATEGREYLARLLTMLRAPSQLDARARTLDSAAALAYLQGDHPAAEALYEESLAICRELGQGERVGWCHFWLGQVARAQGEYERACVHFERSLATAREAGDEQLLPGALTCVGRMALLTGHLARAADIFQEHLATSRQRGQLLGVAHALVELANVSNAEGNPRTARAFLEEARAVGRELAGRMDQSHLCINQGHVLLSLGDHAAARTLFEEGLALRPAAGAIAHIAWALLEAGHAAWLQGEPKVTRSYAVEALQLLQEPEMEFERTAILAALEAVGAAVLAQGVRERAARLMGAAQAQRGALGLAAPEWWRQPQERIADAVRAASLQ